MARRARVRNLTKTFGNVVAVNNVSFEVKDKEFLVLLGPQAAAKLQLSGASPAWRPLTRGSYIGDTLANEFPPNRLSPRLQNLFIMAILNDWRYGGDN